MKHNAFLPLLIAGAAVIIAGCGKSAEFKKMESDLYASVASMHDEGMSLMNKGNDLSARIDEAIAKCDSMEAKYPNACEGHPGADLKTAKEKLASAASSMKNWMAEMKPFDPTMDHAEVMAQLTKEKDGITKVKADFQDAITAATAALEKEKACGEEMAAKHAKTVKKAAKK